MTVTLEEVKRVDQKWREAINKLLKYMAFEREGEMSQAREHEHHFFVMLVSTLQRWLEDPQTPHHKDNGKMMLERLCDLRELVRLLHETKADAYNTAKKWIAEEEKELEERMPEMGTHTAGQLQGLHGLLLRVKERGTEPIDFDWDTDKMETQFTQALSLPHHPQHSTQDSLTALIYTDVSATDMGTKDQLSSAIKATARRFKSTVGLALVSFPIIAWAGGILDDMAKAKDFPLDPHESQEKTKERITMIKECVNRLLDGKLKDYFDHETRHIMRGIILMIQKIDDCVHADLDAIRAVARIYRDISRRTNQPPPHNLNLPYPWGVYQGLTQLHVDEVFSRWETRIKTFCPHHGPHEPDDFKPNDYETHRLELLIRHYKTTKTGNIETDTEKGVKRRVDSDLLQDIHDLHESGDLLRTYDEMKRMRQRRRQQRRQPVK